MAKMTLGKISAPSFTKSMEELIKEKLPIKTAFKIKTLTNKFNDELKKFKDLRTHIVESHCIKDEEGNPSLDDKGNYQFSKENNTAFIKEMNELLSIEIEFDSINVEELSNLELTADALLSLGDIIEG